MNRNKEDIIPSAALVENSAIETGKTDTTIKLTLRQMCEIIGVEVPTRLADIADEKMPGMRAGTLTINKGCAFFMRPEHFRNPLKTAQLALKKGAKVIIARAPLIDEAGVELPVIIHPEPTQAFVQVNVYIRRQHKAKIIAVTGSIGKTTTKEMVNAVVSAQFNTVYSRDNQNGVGQVGRYIQKLEASTEVYIQENGAARMGSIRNSAKMLQPDAFIVSNIGINHIENYGGKQENIIDDKMSHDDYMSEDGVAFLNYDDEILRDYKLKHRTIYYSLKNPSADYYAEGISSAAGTLSFAVVEKSTGIKTPLSIHAFGLHNVLNGLVAFAVGRWLGMTEEQIILGLKAYHPKGIRQNYVRIGGQRVFIDCYNSSEESLKTAVETMANLKIPDKGKRILVAGDIAELGEFSKETHRRIGKWLEGEKALDIILLFGSEMKYAYDEISLSLPQKKMKNPLQPLFKNALHTLKKDRIIRHTKNRDELNSWIRELLKPEDAIGFKASNAISLTRSIDEIFGTTYTLLDRGEFIKRGFRGEIDNFSINVLEEFGAILLGFAQDAQEQKIALPSEFNGEPMLVIFKSAFVGNEQLKEVTVPAPIRTIGQAAFLRCVNLEKVSLPGSLKVIEPSAFNNCQSLKELLVPEGVHTMGRRALFRCRRLKRLELPASLKTIGEDVLKLASKVIVTCPDGSYAAKHIAKEYPNLKLKLTTRCAQN